MAEVAPASLAFRLLDLPEALLIELILILGPWGSAVLRRTCKQLRGVTNEPGFHVGLLDVPYLLALPAWAKQGDVCSLLTAWKLRVHGPSRLRGPTIDQRPRRGTRRTGSVSALSSASSATSWSPAPAAGAPSRCGGGQPMARGPASAL